jgi:aminoglycoside phosphotransferase (APT) family kinase protein
MLRGRICGPSLADSRHLGIRWGVEVTALDIEQPQQLIAWLRETRRISIDETPEVRVLSGGVSNRTVLVRRSRGDSWVLKQALEQLRVPVEWRCSPDRSAREALGMRWLATLAPSGAIPPYAFEDSACHVVAMRAIPEPHANWKTVLLSGEVKADHVRQFGQLLGTIHRQSRMASRTLSEVFQDRGFFEVLRLEPFYDFTATRVPRAASFLRALSLASRSPGTALVHGDFSPKNILLHRGQLLLVDHEVIHWGDPMFDLGFALAHLLSKAHALPAHRAALGGAALLFWEHYRFVTCDCLAGGAEEARAVRHALGCLLARAAGRSQLEYLDGPAKGRQILAAGSLCEDPPPTVAALADRFLHTIQRLEASSHAENCPSGSP